MWTDVDATLALAFDVVDQAGQLYDRRTFILDEDGDVVLVYEPSNVGTHPAEVLEDCQALFGSR